MVRAERLTRRPDTQTQNQGGAVPCHIKVKQRAAICSAINTSIDKPTHSFSDLFAQLGLPSDEQSIQQFLTKHAPLPLDMALADAPFWEASHATFLREAFFDDSDWAEPVDQLSEALRQPKKDSL